MSTVELRSANKVGSGNENISVFHAGFINLQLYPKAPLLAEKPLSKSAELNTTKLIAD